MALLRYRLGRCPGIPRGVRVEGELWALARRHRVHTLLRGVFPVGHEEDRWARLWRRVQVQHLIRIQGLLESAGISVIALKGPALAQQLYGDPEQRPSVDLDFLVFPGRWEKALDILQQSGYTLKAPAVSSFPLRQRKHLLARTHHWILVAQGLFPLSVEIHLRLLDPRWRVREDVPGVFQRAQELWVAGAPVRVLGPEDLVHYLALHGTKHAWNRLLWLADLARALILYAPSLDWESLVRRARQWRSLRMLTLGLYLAHEVLQAPVPKPLRRRFFPDPWVQRWAHKIQRNWTEGAENPPRWISRTCYEAQIQGGSLWPLVWTRSLVEQIFQPTLQDFLWVPLPEVAFSLYPLLRPWRILYHFFRKNFFRFRQSP